MKKTKTIKTLGISLGTRSIGIALLDGEELLDWKVQCFKGHWNKNKCSLIAGTIKRHLVRYAPDRIALKTPTDARPSRQIQKLVAVINRLLSKKQLPLYCYTLTDLKECFGSRNRAAMIQTIAGSFPELSDSVKRAQRARNAGYYNKMFEAVASALLCDGVSRK